MKRSEIERRLKEAFKRSMLDASTDVLYVEEGTVERLAAAMGIEVEPDELAMPTILWFEDDGLVGDRCGWRSYRIGGVPEARTLAVVECDKDSASVVRRLVDFRNDEMRRR